MEGKKFKHKYLPYLTCVVVAATRKGTRFWKPKFWAGAGSPKQRQPTTTTLILIKSVVCGRKKASNNR